ncbi:MAG: alpha/beta hydrolase [Firmicutes bacterium]|nr:alpha/beta hydrolase [Bacillota bacterium]
MAVGKRKMRKKRIGIAIVVLLLLAAVGAWLYISDYYPAGEKALAIMEHGTEEITLGEPANGDWISFAPADRQAQAGIIFYPGGKVQCEAYAPLMEKVAAEGVFCVLVHMPGNLAVLDRDAAADVMKAYPEIGEWYIGGHSLGGVMAAEYASKHPEDFEGIFFLAAYTTKDLSDTDLKGLRVYGSEDRVLNYDSLEKNEENLPENHLEAFVIEGGNHAQFGDYGPQKGDGKAAIPAEEQWQITAEALVRLTEDQ